MLTGKTSAGANVFAGRYIPLDRTGLPAVVVYIQKEAVVMNDTVYQKRTAKAVIECLVDAENPDAGIDTLTDSIEQLLLNDETLGGVIHTAKLTDVEMAVDEESGSHIEGARMMYDCEYFVEAVADAGNDNLETVVVEHGDGAFEDVILVPHDEPETP